MVELFLKKKGDVIYRLASNLLQLKKGDRLPSVSEYQELFQVSRGTVQNAMAYLKEAGAFQSKSKGHLGSYIESVDYSILQTFALSDTIMGTMTLPYSKLYEGLATGIYDEFRENRVKLNLAYIRGSKERLKAVARENYHFAVLSKFAALKAIEENTPIDIVVDFGKHTYLSEHILIFADKKASKIINGMKVAIDYNSIDQQLLTEKLIYEKNVELVEVPGHQIVSAVRQGIVDVGVWNYDEIVDKNYQDIHYIKLSSDILDEQMSTSVIVVHTQNKSLQAFFKQSFQTENVLTIQRAVYTGTIIPQY
ncbi:GntR family transcriptional regulator [Carnobacteriaceae bacterium zg-84]|uniref:GntR family transcriptional regulator YhfZ n=1 Tax=Granulicatella sp. zg-84 TaxID=2678503 RepID=UPI0013BF250D|nr:GntR family transcriptional regulator YhfZ [Granulicatella sp. zg-84]NEW65799.1 GntR family transcriptional regulator [Granulicatella sp. zg-84]QMI86304.1 GntR family transcriptional regulator [Carnobacteriaceae bacterium zg-84]